MYHDSNFSGVLASSARAAWQIDEVLPDGAALDFTRPFMPENLARTAAPRAFRPTSDACSTRSAATNT